MDSARENQPLDHDTRPTVKGAGESAKLKRCPSCYSRLSENVNMCPICGHELIAQIRPEPIVIADTEIANTELEIDESQETIFAPPPTPQPHTKNMSKRRIPWGVIGVAAVILTFVLGAIYLLRDNSAPNQEKPIVTATLLPPVIAQVTLQPTAIQVTQTPVRIIRTPTALPPIEYVVQANDTCGDIAVKYRVPLNQFLRLNGLSEECIIAVGAKLKLPPPTPTPGPSPTPEIVEVFGPLPTRPVQIDYEVKDGDSCGKIAQENNIPISQIITINKLDINCTIKTGQKLILVFATPSPIVTTRPIVAQTPTPRSVYGMPYSLVPVSGSVITRAQEVVTLEWLSVGTLQPNEWYIVQIQPSGSFTVPIFETKSSSLKITSAILNNQPERMITWWVQVKRLIEVKPTGERVYVDISPPSEIRQFLWKQ
jgi:LysM repeat protein/RNA polymerase subunit RPABC4/transcription elongation factor Spt4